MLRTITRLLFGREEETPEDVKSGEVVEEGWHVVTHQEAGSAENHDPLLTDSQPSVPRGNTNMETDCAVDADPTVQSRSTTTTATQSMSSSFSKPKAVAEITQLTCVQKAKVSAERHHVSRNAIQRQNRVRQGVQHHSYHLQQPGYRSLSH